MTLDDIQEELRHANDLISQKLQLPAPGTFAYPCGQKFVGTGTLTKSYVPVAAELFEAARGWNDEAPNHPAFCDMAQLMAISSDNKSYAEILGLIEKAKKQGGWLILAGHEIGTTGPQNTSVEMLRQLLAYLSDPANGIWIAPLGGC
ncbi:MAG: hypothetical protein IPL46_32170 [Saprospiraceae bacterium]|nr:hypothetical protein [Saprospiraceae bacterium]